MVLGAPLLWTSGQLYPDASNSSMQDCCSTTTTARFKNARQLLSVPWGERKFVPYL